MADPTLQTLTTEIDKKLVDPLRRVLIGRQLVHVTDPAGFGVSAVNWSKITEMSAGMVSYAFSSGNSDTLNAEPTVQKIPVYWKDWDLDRRQYEGYKMNGIDIDTSASISAGFVAAKVEDSAIIQGVTQDGTNYDINGLYQGAGSDYSTTKDFGTFGAATDAIAGAFALYDAADIPTSIPFNLTLAPTQAQELRASRSTNGVKEMPDILEMLNGGAIKSSNAMTAGTGMLTPTAEVGEPYVDFYLTKDWGSELGFDSEHPDTGDMKGRVYSSGILRIKHDVALCKLSSI